jgi:hypothetical protein
MYLGFKNSQVPGLLQLSVVLQIIPLHLYFPSSKKFEFHISCLRIHEQLTLLLIGSHTLGTMLITLHIF